MFRFHGLLLSLLLLSGSALAEPSSGSSEIEVFGNYVNRDGDSSLIANVAYGYYFNSQVRWTVGLSAFGSEFGGDSDIKFGGETGVTYHFSATGNTGYISGNLYLNDVEEASDTSAIEALLGYRSYLNETTALFYEVGYRSYFEDIDDEILANIGIAFLFD
jgi:hypothetical protein